MWFAIASVVALVLYATFLVLRAERRLDELEDKLDQIYNRNVTVGPDGDYSSLSAVESASPSKLVVSRRIRFTEKKDHPTW